jgi:hypothetical protein
MGKGPLCKEEENLWVKRTFADEEPLEWWSWGDLNDETRNGFLTTRIPTIEVEGELREIIDLFVRINATGKRLTSQERRHAHYYTSPVLKASQRLADGYARYFEKHRIVVASQRQRMRHVELMTELLLAASAGMPLHKKKQLDRVIANRTMSTEDLGTAERKVRRALKALEAILPHLRTTRFRQIADFYTLVVLLCRFHDEGSVVNAHSSERNALAGALLTDFGRGVDEASEKIRKGHGTTASEEPFRQYLMTVRDDTDSRAQRDAREKILRFVLEGVFERRDVVRNFNATQRRILWHVAQQKVCSLCKKPIRRWEDLTIDHIVPFSRGGATTLGNAALAHGHCNASKGARQR